MDFGVEFFDFARRHTITCESKRNMINITLLCSKSLNLAKIYLWNHEPAISFWFASESMIGTNLEEDSSRAQNFGFFDD